MKIRKMTEGDLAPVADLCPQLEEAHRFYEGLGYAKLKTQAVFEKRL